MNPKIWGCDYERWFFLVWTTSEYNFWVLNGHSFMSKYFGNMDIVTVPVKRLNLILHSASFNILSKIHNHLNKKYTA